MLLKGKCWLGACISFNCALGPIFTCAAFVTDTLNVLRYILVDIKYLKWLATLFKT